MMAKKSSRRRSFVRKLKCSESLGLAALAAGAAVSSDFDDSVSEKMYLLSIEATHALAEHTANEGPIVVGVAHSDYTSAEILEWFVATSGWDTGDKIAQEHQRRKIRQVGTFAGNSNQEVLNDGKAIKTPLRFTIESGQTLQQFAINSDAAVLTTGTFYQINGQVWAKSA